MNDSLPDIMENHHWLHPAAPGPGWPLWLALGCAVLIAALLAWHRLRRRGAEAAGRRTVPHVDALRALEALRHRLTEEEQLAFVVEVSQIVRDYIQERFGLRAPHLSTEEFLREAQESGPLLRDHQELLGGFLTQCDLVKFARRRVVLQQMNGLLDAALRFVESTVPSASPAAAVGEGA